MRNIAANSSSSSENIVMAEVNQVNGSLFCQATVLSQSVADRASASLADGRHNTIQKTKTGQKFRKNTLEELRRKRLKRNKARKNKMRQMTKKEKRSLIKTKIVKHLEAAHEKEIAELTSSMVDTQKKAVFFWKKWKESKLLCQSQRDCSSGPKEVNRQNLKNERSHSGEESLLGQGVFGVCFKKLYRGIAVAVKQFRENVPLSLVKHEASILAKMDHPGLPLLFGCCTDAKPYLLVTQFHGIEGHCVTFKCLVQNNLNNPHKVWCRIMYECADALSFIHSKNYLHNDLKGDNVIISEGDNSLHPVIIDFGKSTTIPKAKVYKLSLRDQEKYRKHHKHIAPEVVRGTHPQSPASDVYGFGLLLSLLCKHKLYESLRKLAFSCINGNPEKRPTTQQLVTELFSQYTSQLP